MKLSTVCLAVLVSLFPGAATVSYSAIVGTTGYEGAPAFETGYYYTYAFDYAGYGNGGPNVDLMDAPVVTTALTDPTSGVGGSGAMRLEADASAVPIPGQAYPTPTDPAVVYSYYGIGGGSGLAIQNAPTSANLADYQFSIDLRAIGLIAATTAVEFSIEFQAPDDTLGVDEGTGADILLALSFTAADGRSLLVGPDFATFSATLDQYSAITNGSLENFALLGSLTSNINVNLQVNNGVGEFGIDADNALLVDNQTIEQIPEPSAGLALLAGVALALARRRTAFCAL